jgi:polyribonucleotide nucleotidyltransferase
MNSSIDKPRSEPKENTPVVKKFEVPAPQRARFVGMGYMNLKKIFTKTGATVSAVDETTFSVFAPNKNSYEEAEEMMKQLLEQQVTKLRFIYKTNF